MDSAPKSKPTSACPRCGGRLRLRPEQNGSQVVCPKCGQTFVVGAKPPPPPPRPQPEDDSYLPEMPLPRSNFYGDGDPLPQGVTIVHDPPPVFTEDDAYQPEIPLSGSILGGEQLYGGALRDEIKRVPTVPLGESDNYDREARIERPALTANEYLKQAELRGLITGERDVDPPPRWTFFSDVLTFPFLGENLWRWAGMSAGMLIAGPFLIYSVTLLLSTRGGGIGTPFLFAAAAALLSVCGAFAAACFVAAVQDTSDGFRKVQADSLPELRDWIFLLLGMGNVLMLSGAAGYPLTLVPQVGPIAVPISMLVFFPIFLLSAMESDSFLAPFSAATWRTLGHSWSIWLLFYLLSTVLIAGCAAALYCAYGAAPTATTLLGGTLIAATLLVYARLLGRLAWRVGVATDDDLGETTVAGTPRKSPSKRKRKKRRVVSAAELDAAAAFLAKGPPKT